MFTERTHPTRLRLRRTVAGLALAGVVLGGAGAASAAPTGDATPAPAEVRTSTDPAAPAVHGAGLDAARQVAERRAGARRRQVEATREQTAAFLAELAAQAQADRVGPVVGKGETALGRPYVRGAAGPNAFDCSGFTRWAWEAAGLELPHYTGAQWAMAEHISIDDLQPGDLVFYWGSGDRDPGHVGLYVGDGQMIHAPGSGRSVRYESIWYWSGARVAAGRVG